MRWKEANAQSGTRDVLRAFEGRGCNFASSKPVPSVEQWADVNKSSAIFVGLTAGKKSHSIRLSYNVYIYAKWEEVDTGYGWVLCLFSSAAAVNVAINDGLGIWGSFQGSDNLNKARHVNKAWEGKPTYVWQRLIVRASIHNKICFRRGTERKVPLMTVGRRRGEGSVYNIGIWRAAVVQLNHSINGAKALQLCLLLHETRPQFLVALFQTQNMLRC